MKRPAARSSLVHAAFAFAAMGSWAMFANREHGVAAMLVGGAVQGALSACITLCLKHIIENLVLMFAGWLSRIMPVIICFLLSLFLLSAIHILMGTPEVLTTIAIPLSVSTLYAAAYSQAIFRQSVRMDRRTMR